MITNELDFVTPRPHWATTTDVASENVCAHVRDFSVGDVAIEIRQEDTLVDGHVVYGRPEIVIQTDGRVVPSPPDVMRLMKALEAAAHHCARIGR